MSDLAPPSSPAPARGLIIGAFLALALALGGLLMLFVGAPSTTDWSDEEQAELDAGVDFPPLRIDEARLQRERDAFYDEPDTRHVDDEIAEFKQTLGITNANQFRTENPVLTEHGEDPSALLPYQADEILTAIGPGGFHVISEPFYEACLEGLDELTRDIAAERIAFDDALTDPGEGYDGYRLHCGNLLPALHAHGLLDDQGHWQIDQPLLLVDLLQRYRQADLIRNRFSLHRQLPQYDLDRFHRWRIQSPEAFDLEIRRQFLDRAPSFIDDERFLAIAQARMSVEDGQPVDGAFDPLLEQFPDDPFIAALVDTVRP